jgi:hypothetical protein
MLQLLLAAGIDLLVFRAGKVGCPALLMLEHVQSHHAAMRHNGLLVLCKLLEQADGVIAGNGAESLSSLVTDPESREVGGKKLRGLMGSQHTPMRP